MCYECEHRELLLGNMDKDDNKVEKDVVAAHNLPNLKRKILLHSLHSKSVAIKEHREKM